MTRRIAILAGILVAVGFVLLGFTEFIERDDRLQVTSLPSVSAPVHSEPGTPDAGGPEPADAGNDGPPLDDRDGGGEDGDLDGRTVSVDSTEPAVDWLDHGLRDALRAAAGDAAGDGIEVRVSSGWRSKSYQQRLLDEAIVTYGSRGEALRWVSTPDTSDHVTGHAVDVSPTDAAYWMSEHGSAYGLCQTYANEIWHYELLTSPGGTCPPPLPDSASAR